MDTMISTALQDLLAVRALSEISPQRVQTWQGAARTLLAAEPGVADPPKLAKAPAKAAVPENDHA